jgi:hypothetical protein
MNKLSIVLACAAAALLGGSAAKAADATANAKAGNVVTQQSTDISSRNRHRHHGQRHYGHRHYYGYRNYRPYYGNSYGYYAPRPYGGYGYGGPGITFSFGSSGYRGW